MVNNDLVNDKILIKYPSVVIAGLGSVRVPVRQSVTAVTREPHRHSGSYSYS